MKNKYNRMNHRTRQRQKLSRRTVIIIAASSMTCLVIGFVVFLNLSRSDKMMAKPVSQYIIQDASYTDEKTLPAPIVAEMPVMDENTQLVRKVKPLEGAE